MNSLRLLNTLLAVIATLLLGILLALVSGEDSGLAARFVKPAYAQAAPNNANLVFHPWVNPRKYIFWDSQNSTIYIYDGGGSLDETLVVGRMGEKLQKK